MVFSPHRPPKAHRELRCRDGGGYSRGLLATGVARDCGDVGSVAGWPSGREWNGLQPAKARLNWVSQGQRRGRCKVRRRAERVIRPTRAKTRRLRVLVITVRSPRPIRAVQRSRHHLDRQPGAVGREAPRRSARRHLRSRRPRRGGMIGLHQRLPIAAVMKAWCIWRRGRAGNPASPADNEPRRRGVRLGLERG